MSDPEPPLREAGESYCCCVIIHDDDIDPIECYGLTTGPDDPFCDSCAGRHLDDPLVRSGYTVVTQRLHRKEPA